MPCDPASLHPGKGADPYSCILHFALFEGLTRFSKNNPYELALAQSISVSKDEKCYTFKLKKCYWSNKKPLTAHDFYRSWSKILDPEFPAPNAHLFYPIANAKQVKQGLLPKSSLGLKVIDDNTFQVTLQKPTPYFLKLIAFCCFSPHYQKLKEEKEGPFVGNGPFILDSYKVKDRIILMKNPHYHDQENIKINSAKISIINDENTAYNLYKKGELDILGAGLTDFPQDCIQDLEKKNLILSHQITATSFFSFNTKTNPFNNKNLRKAFILAIDNKLIVDHIIGKNGNVANNIIPHTTLHSSNSKDQNFDPILARKYLERALIELKLSKKDLPCINMYYYNKSIEKKTALSLQQQWKKHLGLNIILEECEFKILMDRVCKKKYSLALCALCTQYDDPMAILQRFQFKSNQKNYPSFENKKYQQLLELANELPKKQRDQVLLEAQDILMNEAVLGPIHHFNLLFIKQPKIKTIFLSKIGSIHLNSISLDPTEQYKELHNEGFYE